MTAQQILGKGSITLVGLGIQKPSFLPSRNRQCIQSSDHVLVSYYCLINHHESCSLRKTHFLADSDTGQESGHALAGSLLGVSSLESGCQLGCDGIWESGCTSRHIQVLAEFSSRTEVHVSLLAVGRGPSELTEATLRSELCGAAYFCRPSLFCPVIMGVRSRRIPGSAHTTRERRYRADTPGCRSLGATGRKPVLIIERCCENPREEP